MKIYGIVGWKNTGKTGLMERLVAEFTARGLNVSTVKHAHHAFDVDQQGKDSFRHRTAGAQEVLLTSHKRWALMHELRGDNEPELNELLAKIAPCDLVLVEGYKRDIHPKIEVFRKVTGKTPLSPDDPTIRAVAADIDLSHLNVPLFDLDDTLVVADFILTQLGLNSSRKPPKPMGLKDDCFALPDGVAWTPVDTALTRLRNILSPVTPKETVPVPASLNRVLAQDHFALRANPPGANAAVDGYGFSHAALPAETTISLPLLNERAAAGAPFSGTVPPGSAVRILTGALLPKGVDSVVMQEDVTLRDGHIRFGAGIKPGANARAAGEDMNVGALALPAGHVMRAPDIALLTGLGLSRAQMRRTLRVGVLSTGDELVAAGATLDPAATYDANRPMLLALAEKWGYDAVDLGHVPDDYDALRNAFQAGVQKVDVILTSGGASAGDADHVSALLSKEAQLSTWRVAIKPGRPLALAMWQGVPVFGLPGNPVAAFVCALIFARPAFSVLSGAGWITPLSIPLAAAFSKSKKAGRREYLRARMNTDGTVEAFSSEGSGRISGLSWANGLIELDEPAQDITPGDSVRFLPYAGFGI